MSDSRQIAVVRNYDEFKNALRARADELQLSRETLDAFGLAKGHAGHLLAPVPIKHIGPQSFGVLLTALGLKVLVVEDMEAFNLYAADAPKSKSSAPAHVRMRTRRKHRNKGNRKWGKQMAARRVLILSEQKRSQIARKAARIRWDRESRAAGTSPAVAPPGPAPSPSRPRISGTAAPTARARPRLPSPLA